VLAVIAPRLPARAERVLRLYDHLLGQAESERERQHIAEVRRALMTRSAAPPPLGAPIPSVVPHADASAWLAALCEGYRRGRLRDEDLLFAPSFAPLRARYALAQVLRVSRAFA
jgi:hypothetical protein